MRIAIIGTGISGLTAAHLLHPAHDVTVFEAGDHVGGHTNTISVDAEDGPWAVDTGFIVLNDRNYPRFEVLLDELEVPRQPTNMSFSVSAEEEDFEYASRGLRGLVAQPSNLARPRFLAMVADYVRFNRAARRLLRDPDDDRSLGSFLDDEGFSSWFIDRLLVPQAAAVWSADPAQMWTFPARFLVQFFAHHGMLSLTGRPRWSTVAGGSARYVEALTAPFAGRIRARTPVVAVARHATHVDVVPDGGPAETFDEVVIAAHADDALALLSDPSPAEVEVLGAFAYQANEAVLHTDRSLLPRRRTAWEAAAGARGADKSSHRRLRPPSVEFWASRPMKSTLALADVRCDGVSRAACARGARRARRLPPSLIALLTTLTKAAKPTPTSPTSARSPRAAAGRCPGKSARSRAPRGP